MTLITAHTWQNDSAASKVPVSRAEQKRRGEEETARKEERPLKKTVYMLE